MSGSFVNRKQRRKYVNEDFKTDAEKALVLKDSEICFIRPGGELLFRPVFL
jgi:hypothetical protein